MSSFRESHLREMTELKCVNNIDYANEYKAKFSGKSNKECIKICKELDKIQIHADKIKTALGDDESMTAYDFLCLINTIGNDDHCVILKDNEEQYIGLFYAQQDEGDIKNIDVISFIDTNNFSLTKYVIKYLFQVLNSGHSASWFALNTNPILPAYIRFTQKYNGTIKPGKKTTKFIIKPAKNRIYEMGKKWPLSRGFIGFEEKWEPVPDIPVESYKPKKGSVDWYTDQYVNGDIDRDTLIDLLIHSKAGKHLTQGHLNWAEGIADDCDKKSKLFESILIN